MGRPTRRFAREDGYRSRFLSALENGYNINVATTTLDASGARTFASFTRGGGMDLER